MNTLVVTAGYTDGAELESVLGTVDFVGSTSVIIISDDMEKHL